MPLANENSSWIASLTSRLKYLDKKNQFKWYGDFKDLICLVETLLEFTEDGEISEGPAHKMFSFKAGDIIEKWYSSTHTVQTQGSVYATLREKLGNFIASKENLLTLQPSCDTQQCPLAASNESTAVNCSQNTQTLPSPPTCEGCSVVNSNLQNYYYYYYYYYYCYYNLQNLYW